MQRENVYRLVRDGGGSGGVCSLPRALSYLLFDSFSFSFCVRVPLFWRYAIARYLLVSLISHAATPRNLTDIYKKKSRIEWNSRGLLATNARVLIAHFHCPPRQALAWMLRRRPSRFYAGPTSLLMDRSGKRGQNGQLRRHHSRSRIVREKEERRIFCAWNSRPLVEMPLLLSYHLFFFLFLLS